MMMEICSTKHTSVLAPIKQNALRKY